jgi:hypothetical protein
MFFSICFDAKSNFPHCHKLANFYVSTDAGWLTYETQNHSVIYKGYAEQFDLNTNIERIISQNTPEFLGNFCVLVLDHASNKLHIKTDLYRSFPIYYNSQEVTNLKPLEYTAWTDSLVEISNHMVVSETKFDVIGPMDSSTVSLNDALDFVHNRLAKRTQEFLSHNTLPVRVFLSGGVDSLLVYSYLQRFNKDYSMVRCSHIEYDYFYLMNKGYLANYWAYKQIHHWQDPCILTSGAPGDEFMLRSPYTSDLYSKTRGVDIAQLLVEPQWTDCLHYEYFQKHLKVFVDSKVDIGTISDWDLCNNIVNDWQHWHLGHTLTWTPLRDLEIFKMILRLPQEHALGQIMNSEFSLRLIERNKSGLSTLVSDQKNTGHVFKNLTDFLLNHPN